MVSESPWSNFVRVSDIIFKYLDTHNPVWMFDGHKIVNNLCLGLICSKSGSKDVILPKKQFRFKRKVLHSKIACFSSSILLLEQYLYSLEVTGVTGLVYLPDSIPRFGTALTRYLVSQARWIWYIRNIWLPGKGTFQCFVES